MITVDSLQTLLMFVTLISVPVGVFYHILTLRNQSRAREAQFLLQLNQTYQDKEGIRDWYEVLTLQFQDYQDFLEKYDSTVNLENYLQRSRIYRMLNTFGHILKRGLVNPKTVYDGMNGTFIIRMWNSHSPIIRELRKVHNAPLYLEGFEYCATAMKKVEESKLHSIT